MNTISLLNCFYREDVITDLISNLISGEEEFAKWFARTICNVSESDAKFVSKPRIGLGRGIGTPDLVIEKKVNSKTDLIIVIENKIGALEGTEQTNRYALDEGKKSLYSKLNVDKSVPIKFLFLTLDPYTPAGNLCFEKKDYTDFIHVNWNEILENEVAIRVMSDFSTLLRDFYEPIRSSKLIDNIAIRTQSLNPLQKKLIWINMFQSVQERLPKKLKMTFGEAGGFGRNAAVFCDDSLINGHSKLGVYKV